MCRDAASPEDEGGTHAAAWGQEPGGRAGTAFNTGGPVDFTLSTTMACYMQSLEQSEASC